MVQVNDTLDAAFGLIGFLVGTVCFCVGAFVCLRWGYNGVFYIWKHRKEIDARVQKDIKATIGK